MTTKLAKHTPGALRAATIIARLARDAARMSGAKMVGGNNLPQAQIDGFAMIIDGETAAPAMLEALKSCLGCLQMECEECYGECPCTDPCTQCRAKAAIRAAVGEQEENTP